MPPGETPLAESVHRHDWVWLDPRWRDRLAAPPQDGQDEIESWQARGLPFVVARSLPQDRDGAVRLGLSLTNRRRIGFVILQEAIRRRAEPPLLSEAAAAAPRAWRANIARLAEAAAALGAPARVYGSLAWSLHSGDSYVTANSDVDLLFAPTELAQAEALLALLASLPEPPRWDGEFALPGGWAAAWRELARRPPSVLLKGRRSLTLCGADDVFAAFASGQPPGQASGRPRC